MSTFTVVPERPNFPKEEETVLQFWNQNLIFERCADVAAGKPKFSFYDGPPFATGLPHYGHILAGTIKDIVTRYAYQNGYDVSRRFGWDCHGLPIEYEIDKELGISSREDVLKYGIANYNEKCRSIVMRYAEQWEVTIKRLGRWIDFKNDYRTMNLSYMESVWWACSELYKKGMIYKEYKVMPYSTACSTPLSNFESNLNYKEVVDPTVIVTFPWAEREDTEFLAWTTTPWTLPSNLAVCLHPDMLYVKFRCTATDKIWVLAESRLDWFKGEMQLKEEDAVILEKHPGSYFIGIKYIPLYNYFNGEDSVYSKTAFKAILDTFVTDDAGTGIVHCAPAFGEEDSKACVAHGIVEGNNLPCPVDDKGCFTSVVSDYSGLYVKTADKEIKQHLSNIKRNILSRTIVHSYPHCWRSDTPLLYKAVPSWFIRVESMRERLLANNATTYWVPDFVKEKRFHNWLSDAKDWCFSRNRFWGTPIPIWCSEDGKQMKCFGSVKELEVYAGRELTDIHRHFVDDIVVPDPRGDEYPPMKRIDEVFDCWFESGSMPYSQQHYPFENSDEFKGGFPADFVSEGIDQTRGWFYTLLVLSTALFDCAPFKNLVASGLVLAADGKKMSKRLKNYPDPALIVNSYGADALRLYLVNSPVVKAESLKFKEEGVKDVLKDVLLPWFHAYRFFIQEVSRFEAVNNTKFSALKFDSEKNKNVMDIWINSVMEQLVEFVRKEMEAYRLYTVAPKLMSFLNQLTNWYVRLNRDRMKGRMGDEECVDALSSLFNILLSITRLMAPYTPFICEYFYGNLKKVLPSTSQLLKESIHYVMVPEVDTSLMNQQIVTMVERMQNVINIGRLMRERKRVTMKTPLKSMTILHGSHEYTEGLKELEAYIKEELNVLEVTYSNDMSKIRMAASPNFKALGSRVGSDMKEVHKKVKELSHEDIDQFIKNGKIQIMTYTLETNDLVIQRLPIDQNNPNILVESDSYVSLMMDFTEDAELNRLSMARELANRIQKLRKQFNFNPMDEIDIWVETEDAAILSVVNELGAYLHKSLRRPLRLKSRLNAFPSIHKLQESMIQLNGADVTVTFTAKSFYFNEKALQLLGDAEIMKECLIRMGIERVEHLLQNGSMEITVESDSNSYSLQIGLHFAITASGTDHW